MLDRPTFTSVFYAATRPAGLAWLVLFILISPTFDGIPAISAALGLAASMGMTVGWANSQSRLSKWLTIAATAGLLTAIFAAQTDWIHAALAAVVLVGIWLGLKHQTEVQPKPVVTETHPDVSTDSQLTLPRWMSEFSDTYGMPTHLRTSRNYIEICNANHSSYVRLSLTSAAQQIPKELGLRVHKEYYVFRSAVRRNLREGGRHFLEIDDKTQIPVGRSFLSAAKAEGLIN